MTKKIKIGLFLGTYVHEITPGTRVSLPSRFRTELSENQVVLTQDKEGCITGFDTKHFMTTSQTVLDQPLFSESGRKLRREIFSSAVPVEVDRLGRIVIPETIKNWAEIKQKVVIAGMGDSFEIWSQEKFNERQLSPTGSFK